MDSLDNILTTRINKLGLNKELQAAYIISQANSLANGRFVALSISNGILTVNCPSSIRAQEIQFESREILAQINEKITPLKVKRLHYRIVG